MLILPLHKKIDWKDPPLVTLLLLALNIMLFMLLQLDDDKELVEAVDYYQVSGLYEFEREGYQAYLEEQKGFEVELSGVTGNSEVPNVADQMLGIQTDVEFLQRLRQGSVIDPQDDNYSAWVETRAQFDSLYEAITYVQYGLRTAHPTWLTLFSHMFLHAGFLHLIGNMIFLLALGILVEAVMGRGGFLLLYLLTGVGSAAFDFLFNSNSLIPGIGASGAISGLMGMYAVIYGLRKIRFFYSIGIYFDYVALPAIVLLPLWIGNELFQLLIYTESHINYLAHLGGLISGAGVAAILKTTIAPFDLSFLDNAEKDRASESRLLSARNYFQDMEYRKALPILRRLFQEGNRERELIYLYYQCSRISPSSEDFHKAARALFNIPERDAASASLIREVYLEYIEIARPEPKFNSKIVCRLADCFLEQKWAAEADKVMNIIVKRGLACPQNRELLTRYAVLLVEQGRNTESASYRELISRMEQP